MNSRNNSIDILRIFAVFLVLGRHSTPLPEDSYLSPFTIAWERCGWVGVDLFFVLSGFLISGLLFKEHAKTGKIDFKRFFIRRGFKIYPSFYVMLCLMAVANYLVFKTFEFNNFFYEVFFLRNYFGGIWAHTWSLDVEEHFYILLPLLLIFLYRRNRHTFFDSLPKIFLFTAIIVLVLRCVAAYSGVDGLKVVFETHYRLDSLFFGVILSYYSFYKPNKLNFIENNKWPFLFCVLLAFGMCIYLTAVENWFLNTFGLTLLYLVFGCLLIICLRSKLMTKFGESLIGRGLAFFGARSYSIYLWHLPVAGWGISFIKKYLNVQDIGTLFLLYIVLSLIVGVVMAAIIELPVLKIRDYLYPSPK